MLLIFIQLLKVEIIHQDLEKKSTSNGMNDYHKIHKFHVNKTNYIHAIQPRMFGRQETNRQKG